MNPFRFSWIATSLAIAAVSGCASAPATGGVAHASVSSHEAITPVKDRRALDALKQMGDALSSAKSMSFDERSVSPLRGPNGQWLHLLKTAEVKMQRPNRLFIKTGGDAFPRDIYFDGAHFAEYAPETHLYTKKELGGDVDEMLARAAKKGGESFTFADVLLENPYASWSKDLEGAIYVGESTREGKKLHHIALTAKNVDWEVWIDEEKHLPRMVYAKYTTEERTPSVMIEFSKWKLNPKISASSFEFAAPAGAKQADFKAPKGANQ